jgi:hypothetical protein
MKVAICPAIVNIPNSLVLGSKRARAPSRPRRHSNAPSRSGSVIKASASFPYSSAVAVPDSWPCLTKCLSRSLRCLNGTGSTFQIVRATHESDSQRVSSIIAEIACQEISPVLSWVAKRRRPVALAVRRYPTAVPTRSRRRLTTDCTV